MAGLPLQLFTVGHGTASEDELVARLAGGGVQSVVDIRIGPGSRRNPHLSRGALEEWLPGRGIAYRWDQRLGGFRKLPAGSPDVALRNDSFRAYASHMRTPEFLDAVDGVLLDAAARPTAVMCSESVWWRCHRRLVADFVVLVRGCAVRHLMPGGRVAEHRPTEGVRVAPDGLLVYDAGQDPLL